MGWNDEEVQNTKKGMSLSSKVLLLIIVCIVFIIMILLLLLMNTKGTTFKITVDGVATSSVTRDTLLTTINNVTYVNIEDFAKLVGYEYHKGEYKASTIDQNKCYVEGKIETTSFYSNSNKIYKLLVDKQNEQYNEYTVESEIQNINQKMYAPLDAISKAFNVLVSYTNSEFQIYTLDYLITIYNTNVINWGYTGIAEQSFENKKALLQGYLIVKKEGGLYKVIDTNNTKEFILDRYTSIEYSENMQEFLVTNSSGKVGIYNLDGTTKIEPIYDSIQVLDKESQLYIIELAKKYGVIRGDNSNVIYPQYDAIGASDNVKNPSNNKKLILDTLIPVYKDKKWGAYDKNGRLVIQPQYDEFGYNLNSIEIEGIKELVEPVFTIKRCDGVVVKKDNKYGLINIKGEELVPVRVDGIYGISGVEDENKKYFMLYNGEEINVIERLIQANKIEADKKEEVQQPSNNELDTNQ